MNQFPAAISQREVRELEDHAASNAIGQKRRMVLVTCASDSDTLRSIAEDTPETFEAMVGHVSDYLQHVQGAQEMAQSALARLAMVGKDAVQPDLLSDAEQDRQLAERIKSLPEDQQNVIIREMERIIGEKA